METRRTWNRQAFLLSMDTWQIVRYLGSGAVGLIVNLGTYRMLMASGTHYILGSMLAFTVSTTVGFAMQKYWTFAELRHKNVPRQFLLYVSNGIFNLGLNTGIVYITVEAVGFHYLLAQTIGAAIVSVWSFYLYRQYVFTGESLERRSQSEASGANRQS